MRDNGSRKHTPMPWLRQFYLGRQPPLSFVPGLSLHTRSDPQCPPKSNHPRFEPMEMSSDPTDILTLQQVVEYLGEPWTYRKVYRLIYRPDPANPQPGFVRFAKLGGRWVTRKSWIEESLNRGVNSITPEPEKRKASQKRSALDWDRDTWGNR